MSLACCFPKHMQVMVMGCCVLRRALGARAYLLCCRLPATAAPVATLWQTGAGVWGLSHEDPWLGAALNDGTVVLLNAEVAMRQGNNRKSVAQVGPAFINSSHSPSGCRVQLQ